MANGGQSGIDGRYGRSAGKRRALDHQYRDTQLSRRLDLCIGRRAAGVFGNDEGNTVIAQQGHFVVQSKRTASGHVTRVDKVEWWLDRIDAANEIMVLRCGLEGQKFLTTEREEGVCAFCTKSSHSTLDIGHALPVITRLFFPRRALQRDKRNIGQPCGLDCVGRDTRRIRVRCVDQKIKLVFGDERSQATRAAKTTASHRHGLLNRIPGAASHGQKQPVAGVISQFSGQNTGIRRAAKNENGACHGV